MKKNITFTNSKQNKLSGVINDPVSDHSRPIIILCHGFASHKNRPNYVNLAKLLSANNLSTLRFDFYGHGESEGKFENITVSQAINDILCSIKYVKKLGYRKIGLLGSSFGGLASIIAASQSKDLYLLALKSPVSDFQEVLSLQGVDFVKWQKQGWRWYQDRGGVKKKLNYSFFLDLKNNPVYNAAKKIHLPTIIVHGDKDEIVPIEQSRKLTKLIENSSLIIVPGSDHIYTQPKHAQQMLTALSDFLIRHS